MRKIAVSVFSILFSTLAIGASVQNFHELSAVGNDGKPVKLSAYKGKVLMVVNTASKCGYTPQYEGLQAVYKKYSDKGLVILGFPSNDFGSQEPGTNQEIAKFCKLNYGVTFPLFEKNSVKGKEIQPVFKFLTEDAGKDVAGEVKWNFEKFLVDKNGKVVSRFRSAVKPNSDEITSKIEELLK